MEDGVDMEDGVFVQLHVVEELNQEVELVPHLPLLMEVVNVLVHLLKTGDVVLRNVQVRPNIFLQKVSIK